MKTSFQNLILLNIFLIIKLSLQLTSLYQLNVFLFIYFFKSLIKCDLLMVPLYCLQTNRRKQNSKSCQTRHSFYFGNSSSVNATIVLPSIVYSLSLILCIIRHWCICALFHHKIYVDHNIPCDTPSLFR